MCLCPSSVLWLSSAHCSPPRNSHLCQACQEARGQQPFQCHHEDTMGRGELKQAPMGLTSEDKEGQAKEEQGACSGNSTTEGQS